MTWLNEIEFFEKVKALAGINGGKQIVRCYYFLQKDDKMKGSCDSYYRKYNDDKNINDEEFQKCLEKYNGFAAWTERWRKENVWDRKSFWKLLNKRKKKLKVLSMKMLGCLMQGYGQKQ